MCLCWPRSPGHCALVYNHNCLGVCMRLATKYVHSEIDCWLPHDLTSRQLWYTPEPPLTIHNKARHKWPRCVSAAAVWRPLNMYGGVSSNEDEMHASNPAICMFYKLFYRGRVRMNTAEHWAHGEQHNIQPLQPTFITMDESLQASNIDWIQTWSLTGNMWLQLASGCIITMLFTADVDWSLTKMRAC